MEDNPAPSSRSRRKRADDTQQGSVGKKQKIKSGKWYEASIAAENARLDLPKMKKCGYHKESASRVGAVSPYNSFTFYLASDSGEVVATNDMAISLADFCRLCAGIDQVHKSEYAKELSDDCSELFQKYIGEVPNNVTIANAIEKGWVILPARLEEMKEANDAARKKKKESEQKEETETESSTAGNSTSNSDTSTSSGSPNGGDGRSIGGESANNHQSESERTICVGLRCKYVDNAAKTCPTYCLQKFDFCKGAFRAKNCLLQEKGTMVEGTGNWKRLGDDEWQCINCYNKKKGVTQARHPPLFNQSPGSDGLSAVLSTSEATARVIYLYAEAEDDESFLALSEVRELMALLRTRGCFEVNIGDHKRLFSCPGYQYPGSVPEDKRSVPTSIADVYRHCKHVGIVQMRVDNVLLCSECSRMREQHKRNEDRRDKHYDQQTKADSHTPAGTLSGRQISERMKKLNIQRKIANAKIARLKSKLEADRTLIMKLQANDGNGNGDKCGEDHSIFCKAVKDMLANITDENGNGVKTFKANIEGMIKEILMEGIRREGGNPTSEDIDTKRVTDFVDFLTSQMCNVSKQMSGKESQVEFSSNEMRIWYSHFCSSQSNFRETRDLSPLCIPSPSTMKKQRALHKVSDNKCTRFYEGRRMQRGEDRPSEIGLLMGDEMKPNRGMYWNTSSHEIVGLANDLLDTKAILKRLMNEEEDEVVEAESIQQWKYVNVITGESFICEYFLNDGSLTGETLLRQFDHVCLSLEMVGSQVLGCVMDAGGNNARFYYISRKGEDLGDDPWLSEDQVTTKCLVDPERSIYLMYCLTHLLKAQRNHLYSSWIDGTKSFKDADGIPFGRALIETLYHRDLNRLKSNQAPRTRITERVVFPTKYTVMAVGDAKIVAEDKTLEEAEAMICEELGVTAEELSVLAAAKIAKHPKKYSRDGDANKTQIHGYRLARVDCLIEKAKTVPAHVDPVDKNSVPSTLRSNLSTLKYLAVVGALFNELLMDRHERFDAANTSEYTTYLKGLMNYYGDWRGGQLKWKEREDADWEETFMEVISYGYLRQGVCSFTHFANHIVDKYSTEPDFIGVRVMDGNSTKLEGVFSGQRGSGHASTGTYGTGLANRTAEQNMAAALRNPMYAVDGLEGEKNGSMGISGSAGTRLFKQLTDRLDGKMDVWTNLWKSKASAPRNTDRFPAFDEREWLRSIASKNVSKFGTGPALAKTPVGRLLSKMREEPMNRSYAATVMSTHGFQHHARLAMDNSDAKPWFDALATIDDDAFDKACQVIQLKFLRFTAEALTGGKDNVQTFELSVREYIVGDEFNTFCSEVLPEPLRNCRIGNVILVTCLSDLHRDWMEEAAIDLASEAKTSDEDETTLTLDVQRDEIHRFVGAAVRRAKSKFEKQIQTSSVCKKTQSLHTAKGALQVIESMYLTKVEAINDENYVSKGYYPQSFQHRDRGACLLLKAEYFDWASWLMDVTRNSLTPKSKNVFKKDAMKVAWSKIENSDGLREGFHALFLFRDDLTVSGDGITAAFNKITKYVFHSFSGWKFKYLMDSARDKAGDTGNVNFRTKMQMTGGGGGSSKKKLSGSALMEHTKEEYKKLIRETADKLEKHGLKSLTKIQMAAILHCKYDKYFYYKTLTRNKLRRELRDKLKTRPIGDDSSSCQDQASAAGAD